MKHAETLTASINYLHKVINERMPTLLEFVNENLNQKFWKADALHTAKFEDKVRELTKGFDKEVKEGHLKAYMWFERTGAHFYMKFKICLNGGSYDNNTQFCHYQEQSVLLGQISEDRMTITGVREKPFEEYDIINFAKEMKKIAKYKEEKKKLNAMYNTIDYTLRSAFC